MTSPFKNAAGAPQVNLDEAEAYDPNLEDGEGEIEIISCEKYETGFGPSFSASVKVVSYNNPQTPEGATRKIKITNLNASDQAGGKAKRKSLREFLAAALGVSPTLDSPDGEHTWSDLYDEVAEGHENAALAGRRIGVKTQTKKSLAGYDSTRYSFKAV